MIRILRKSNLYIILALFVALSGCSSIHVDEPETIIQGIPVIEQPSSQLSIPITINLKPYLKEVERSIPKKFVGEENICEGVSYNYVVNRFPIQFNGKGANMEYDVQCEYSLKLNYCPSCHYLFDSKGTCSLPRVYASCGIGEAMRKMEIGYSSKLGINSNWNFTSKTTLKKVEAIDLCKVTFVNYNATDELISEVTTELKELESEIDKAIQDVDLKPQIQSVWNALREPINLNGYGYVYLNPQKVGIDQLKFENQSAKVDLNLSVKPKINFEFAQTAPTKLPNLSELQKKDGFELLIDIEANYDSLSLQLQKALVGKTIEVNSKKVTFEDVRIHSSKNQRINIAITISGSKKGTLFLEGTPVFHSITQEISIPDLTFDIKTRNALLKSAKWLLNGRIESKIKEATNFNLTTQLNELRKMIEKQLSTEIQPGIDLDVKMNKIRVEDIYPFTHQLFIRLNISGKMEVKM